MITLTFDEAMTLVRNLGKFFPEGIKLEVYDDLSACITGHDGTLVVPYLTIVNYKG